MDKIIDVAAYILKKYRDMTGESLDEMKLHKLLYFTQRESIAILGSPAIDGVFEGWKYGPVCRAVRDAFCNGEIIVPTAPISDTMQYIANNVLYEYGAFETWKLSELSHKECSWQNARKGLLPHEAGTAVLSNDDIKLDAEKIRPYDHQWDMYYDEFETEEGLH